MVTSDSGGAAKREKGTEALCLGGAVSCDGVPPGGGNLIYFHDLWSLILTGTHIYQSL